MFVSGPQRIAFFQSQLPEPLFPKFTNHLVTSNFWETFPSVAVAIPFLLICGFLTVVFLGQKGFCTYACPYGGFFVSRTNCRLEKSGLRTPAINAATVL